MHYFIVIGDHSSDAWVTLPSSAVKLDSIDSLILKLYENDVAEQKYEKDSTGYLFPAFLPFLKISWQKGKSVKGPALQNEGAHLRHTGIVLQANQAQLWEGPD